MYHYEGKTVIQVEQAKSTYQQVIALCQEAGVIEGDELTAYGLLLIVDRLLEDLHIYDSEK